MKKLAAIIIIILFPAIVSAFTAELYNNTDTKLDYWLYWVDHNYTNYPGPANMAGGELQPGKRHTIEYDYPAGLWIYAWEGQEDVRFKVKENVKRIVITPSGINYIF